MGFDVYSEKAKGSLDFQEWMKMNPITQKRTGFIGKN